MSPGCGVRRLILGCIAPSARNGGAAIDRDLYDLIRGVAPTQPVYGTHVLNVIPETHEIAQANRTAPSQQADWA